MTIEFDGEVRDGRIEVPAEIAAQIQGNVHVVLSVAARPTPERTLIDELLDHPQRLAGFQPFTRDEAHDR